MFIVFQTKIVEITPDEDLERDEAESDEEESVIEDRDSLNSSEEIGSIKQ